MIYMQKPPMTMAREVELAAGLSLLDTRYDYDKILKNVKISRQNFFFAVS